MFLDFSYQEKCAHFFYLVSKTEFLPFMQIVTKPDCLVLSFVIVHEKENYFLYTFT